MSNTKCTKLENSYIVSNLRPYLITNDLTKIYTIDKLNNDKLGVYPQIKLTINTENNQTDIITLPQLSNITLNTKMTKIHILQNYPLLNTINTMTTSITDYNTIKEIYLNDNIQLITNNVFDNFKHTLINLPKRCNILGNKGLGTNGDLKVWCYPHNSKLLIKAGYNVSQIQTL